ncbi:MAG: secretin N-terminal domain-containing protein, partial [Planctomycetota bacterium]
MRFLPPGFLILFCFLSIARAQDDESVKQEAKGGITILNLRFADAAATSKIVQQMLSTTGEQKGDSGFVSERSVNTVDLAIQPETNTIILRGAFQDVERARELIEQLDQAGQEVVKNGIVSDVQMFDVPRSARLSRASEQVLDQWASENEVHMLSDPDNRRILLMGSNVHQSVGPQFVKLMHELMVKEPEPTNWRLRILVISNS